MPPADRSVYRSEPVWTRPAPCGSDEFKPIFVLHAQYPDDPGKRFSTATVATCIVNPACTQTIGPGMAQFGWFFLVTHRLWVDSVAIVGESLANLEVCIFMDAQANTPNFQSRTLARVQASRSTGLPPRAVAPGLAGHQAAVPPLGAGAVLDHHRHRNDRRRDGWPVFQAVSAPSCLSTCPTSRSG